MEVLQHRAGSQAVNPYLLNFLRHMHNGFFLLLIWPWLEVFTVGYCTAITPLSVKIGSDSQASEKV